MGPRWLSRVPRRSAAAAGCPVSLASPSLWLPLPDLPLGRRAPGGSAAGGALGGSGRVLACEVHDWRD